MRFTHKEILLFEKLLFSESFQDGTKKNIARQLDGRYPSTATREFVEKMIDLSCLTFVGTKKGRNGRDEFPVYRRDRKRLKDILKQTDLYRLVFKAIDEDYTVIG